MTNLQHTTETHKIPAQRKSRQVFWLITFGIVIALAIVVGAILSWIL